MGNASTRRTMPREYYSGADAATSRGRGMEPGIFVRNRIREELKGSINAWAHRDGPELSLPKLNPISECCPAIS